MFFNNINKTEDVPTFEWFPLEDNNPLGGTKKRRWICNPNKAMRTIHKRLINYLRSLPVDFSSSTAGRPGDSPVENVHYHCDNRYFYLTDISSAYQNVDGEELANVLISIDPSLNMDHKPELLFFLKRYCLVPQGGLAVGLPASPDLFNCYAAVLIDQKIRDLFDAYNVTYTRYLDDLTFSSNEVIGSRKRKKFRKVITDAGFKISHHKSKVLDKTKGAIFINGVGVSEEGNLFLPRHYLEKLNGCIYLAMKGEVELETVEGMMGLFKSLTQKPFNRTEQKTMERYKRFRKSINS